MEPALWRDAWFTEMRSLFENGSGSEFSSYLNSESGNMMLCPSFDGLSTLPLMSSRTVNGFGGCALANSYFTSSTFTNTSFSTCGAR